MCQKAEKIGSGGGPKPLDKGTRVMIIGPLKVFDSVHFPHVAKQVPRINKAKS